MLPRILPIHGDDEKDIDDDVVCKKTDLRKIIGLKRDDAESGI